MSNEILQFKLKKFVKHLEPIKGRHTELVSVLVPAGYDINKVTQQLFEEQGTASNIKSATTRKNVTTALEKMMQQIRIIGRTPPNGLAIYSGNISEQEGKNDFQVFAIEPPIPLKQKIYRCDKTFVLEPLIEMLQSKDIYGLVVMDLREATIGVLKGKTIEVIAKTSSYVPGKQKAGGQSAQRFQRIREGAAKDFYKKVADLMQEHFLFMENLKGIIVGGPGHTKHDLVEKGYIQDQVFRKIIGMRDVAYTDESGLQELLERSEDLLAEEEVAKEKKIMGDFFRQLREDISKIAYGLEHVKQALSMGAVETLLLSESLSEELTEELETSAKKYNTTVRIISTETREGIQLRDIGGAAGILRYAIGI